MAQQFVNPTPVERLCNFIGFDFPCAGEGDKPGDYHAAGADANYNIEAPGIEHTYGKLGIPGKEQGHPAVREQNAESMDPDRQDQVLDINDSFKVSHTGRLSGNGIRYFQNCDFVTIVKMFALPTIDGGPAVPLATIGPVDTVLQAEKPNVWHQGPSENEMLFTAYAEVDPRKVGLKEEKTYRLVVKWEFWDVKGGGKRRMFISGFDDEVSFEMTSL